MNFDAVFNRQKTDSHLKPWDTDFTLQSPNEAYKNNVEIIQKFMVRPKGAVVVVQSPEYATVVK